MLQTKTQGRSGDVFELIPRAWQPLLSCDSTDLDNFVIFIFSDLMDAPY